MVGVVAVALVPLGAMEILQQEALAALALHRLFLVLR
jgi:hypothetical protein